MGGGAPACAGRKGPGGSCCGRRRPRRAQSDEVVGAHELVHGEGALVPATSAHMSRRVSRGSPELENTGNTTPPWRSRNAGGGLAGGGRERGEGGGLRQEREAVGRAWRGRGEGRQGRAG